VRAVRTPAGPATVRIARTGEGWVAEGWGPGAAEVVGRADGMVGAHDERHDELTALVARGGPATDAQAAPALRKLLRATRGVRLSVVPWLFDVVTSFVIRQRVAWRDAARTWSAIVRRSAEPAPGPHGLVLPPSPRAWREAPDWALAEAGVERKRTVVLRALAARASRIDAVAWATPPDRCRARTLLGAFRGVGPWTLESALLYGLGDADAVPTEDFWLPHAMTWALAGEPRGSDARMLELLAPFAGHRGRIVRLVLSAGIEAPRRGPRLPARRTP